MDYPILDTILCTGVLEHVPYPLLLVRDIRRCCTLRHTLVYFEVPRPSQYSLWKRAYRFLSYAVANPHDASSMLKNCVHAGFLRQIHEHQSFYTLDALYSVITRGGFRCLDGGDDGCLWVVAQEVREAATAH